MHIEAVREFNKALQVKPESPELAYTRSGTWLALGNSHYELGRFEPAMFSYNAALSLSPSCIDALNNKGFAMYAAGRRKRKAVKLVEEAEERYRYKAKCEDREALARRWAAVAPRGIDGQIILDI